MADSARLALSEFESKLYADSLPLKKSSVAGAIPFVNSDLPKVFGNVAKTVKDNVKWVYNEAKNTVANYLVRKSLKPYTNALKGVDVHIERMNSESGLNQAYTDGTKLGINESIVPQTNLYSRLMEKLHEHKDKNRFAKYLYDKLSKGYENLKETMKHELIHVYQINSGLADKLVKAAENYIDEHVELPEWVKPYKRVIAFKVAVPAIEGLTEAARHEINGYTPSETKVAISNDPTTYAGYTRTAVDALDGDSPAAFQYKSLRDYGRAAKKYMTNFINLTLSKPQPNYA